MPRELYILFQD